MVCEDGQIQSIDQHQRPLLGPEDEQEARNPLTVSRVVDSVTRNATFTIGFPPERPPDVFFDTNVWVSMTWRDVEALEALRRERGFRYRYSVTNYVELLSRLGRGPSPGWANPFGIVRGAFRKIKHLCEPSVLPSPEMEYLEEVGLSHYLDPAWIPNIQDTAIAVHLIARADTLGDITGTGIQSAQVLTVPPWVVDPGHYLNLTQTDESSMARIVGTLRQFVTGQLTRDNVDQLVPWFVRLSIFFLLVRPSGGRALPNTLSSDEQNQFVRGFTYGAGRVFKSHITLTAIETLNLGHAIDPNDLYDALQLLMLRDSNRLFVTNENSFFRYQENQTIHRVVAWRGFICR
jgi:hypothetical protein